MTTINPGVFLDTTKGLCQWLFKLTRAEMGYFKLINKHL